jgi:hypothetical protein
VTCNDIKILFPPVLILFVSSIILVLRSGNMKIYLEEKNAVIWDVTTCRSVRTDVAEEPSHPSSR